MTVSFQPEHQEQFLVHYHDYKNKIYSYILYRINGNTELAEDITSDVFFKAYKAFAKYDEKSAAFSTWIYRIARNTLIDHFRKNKMHQTEYNDEIHGGENEEHFVDRLDVEIDMKKVHGALETLPDLQREIVVLKLLENFDTHEIAEQVGKTPENVRKILSRGLKTLRNCLIQILVVFSFLWL
jgi:RNA polymerase sigma-70 factor (ECF subfamily)